VICKECGHKTEMHSYAKKVEWFCKEQGCDCNLLRPKTVLEGLK